MELSPLHVEPFPLIYLDCFQKSISEKKKAKSNLSTVLFTADMFVFKKFIVKV